METKQICDLKFSVNGRLIKFTNTILILETEKEITFKDSFDGREKTYSKNYLISKEMISK